MPETVRVRIGKQWYDVEVGDLDGNPIRVTVDGVLVEVDTQLIGRSLGPADAEERVESQPRTLPETRSAPPVAPQPQRQAPPQPQPEAPSETPGRVPSAINVFRSPMPGVIVSVAVSEGDQVVTGDEVCVLEAMKMQQVLRADWTGIVKTVHVLAGQQVQDGDPIIDLE